MWNSVFLSFFHGLGAFNRCTKTNVDCIKFVKLLFSGS